MLNIETWDMIFLVVFGRSRRWWSGVETAITIDVSDYHKNKYIDYGLILDGLEWDEIGMKMGKMGKKMLRCND